MSDKIDKIKPISSTTKASILRKTAYALPLRPSESGMSAEDIKKAFYSGMTDKEDSVMAELERVISEANIAFQSFEENKQESNLGVDNLNKVLITNAQGDITTADKDITPTANSDNLITSGGVHAYPAIKFAENERQKSKNLFDYTDFKALNPNKISGSSENFNVSYISYTNIYSSFKPNTSYTVSGTITTVYDNYQIEFCYTDSTTTVFAKGQNGTGKTEVLNAVSDSAKTIDYIKVSIYNGCTLNFINFQIEEGSVATDYVPYYGQISHSGDKEIEFARNEYEKSKNLFPYEIVNGNNIHSKLFNPLPAGTYTLSAIVSSTSPDATCLVEVYYKGTWVTAYFLTKSSIRTSATKTINSQFDELRFYGGNPNYGYDFTFSQVQLEQGSVATDYQPYNGEIVHEKEIADVEHIETIYDMSSSDSNINLGYTSGIMGGVSISKDVSKYKKLLCVCSLENYGTIIDVDLTMSISSTAAKYYNNSSFIDGPSWLYPRLVNLYVNQSKNAINSDMAQLYLSSTGITLTEKNNVSDYIIKKIYGVY